MFGRHPKLPVDIVFNIYRETKQQSYPAYVDQLRNRMSFAYKTASEVTAKLQKKNKELYDRRLRGASIQCGDKVLVRKVRTLGNNKIADRWEESTYTVIKKYDNLPVFHVKSDTDDVVKTLHRNLLLPIHSVPVEDETELEVIDLGTDEVSQDGSQAESIISDQETPVMVEEENDTIGSEDNAEDISVVSDQVDPKQDEEKSQNTEVPPIPAIDSEYVKEEMVVELEPVVPDETNTQDDTEDYIPEEFIPEDENDLPEYDLPEEDITDDDTAEESEDLLESDEQSDEPADTQRRYPTRIRRPPDRYDPSNYP